MQRDDWLTSDDTISMLTFLQGRAGDRKLRLFACACVRSVEHRPLDSRLQEVIQTVEDGVAGPDFDETIRNIRQGLSTGGAGSPVPEDVLPLLEGMTVDSSDEPHHFGPDSWAISKVKAVAQRVIRLSDDPEAAKKQQCAFLRCLFHWPQRYLFDFGPPLSPAVLSWNDGTVPRIAQGIYLERAFERLPFLGDALLEASAGEENDELIDHCRSKGPHIVGCWVLDHVLGKS